jgi:hypothetical protein
MIRIRLNYFRLYPIEGFAISIFATLGYALISAARTRVSSAFGYVTGSQDTEPDNI